MAYSGLARGVLPFTLSALLLAANGFAQTPAKTNPAGGGAGAPAAAAKTNAPPPVKTGFAGGIGEATRAADNYWDGVDKNNDLHVFVNTLPVLNTYGQMQDIALPCTPNYADMNNDGLKDLVVGDSCGFVWIYINSGEKGKPKFTTGEFLQTYFGYGAKVHVTDWDGDGDDDIVMGTWYGDIAVLINTGTRQKYTFIKSMGIPRYVEPGHYGHGPRDPKDRFGVIMVGKAPLLIGNYLTPWVADWNKDHKPDLLIGEGTYSANSVRLLVNMGSVGRPSFTDDRIFYLAFGEGEEHLTPCVVDYNGDGIDDLIMGTRLGHFRLHKGKKDEIEGRQAVAILKGELGPAVLEFDGFLQIGEKDSFQSMSYAHPCDWNEDGKFDLLLGAPDGKVYLTLNEGSKEKPSFPKVASVKGTDVEGQYLAPTSWGVSILGLCNCAIMASMETVIQRPGSPELKPTAGERFVFVKYVKDYFGWTWSQDLGPVTGCRGMGSHNQVMTMVIGKKYELSFDCALKGKPARWSIGMTELIKEATEDEDAQHASYSESDTISPSGGWQKRFKQFVCQGFHKGNASSWSMSFGFGEGDTEIALDNFVLKELPF